MASMPFAGMRPATSMLSEAAALALRPGFETTTENTYLTPPSSHADARVDAFTVTFAWPRSKRAPPFQ